MLVDLQAMWPSDIEHGMAVACAGRGKQVPHDEDIDAINCIHPKYVRGTSFQTKFHPVQLKFTLDLSRSTSTSNTQPRSQYAHPILPHVADVLHILNLRSRLRGQQR